MTPPPPRIGVILTGGQSRRMGVDKAFVPVAGRAMVARVAAALDAAGCARVECQGGDRRGLAALGFDVVDDRQPGAGPVPAIAQAVARHVGTVVIAACDLPDLDGAAIDSVAAAVDAGAPAAAAVADGHQLVVAFPGRSPAVASLAASGERSMRTLLARLDAVDVVVPAEVVRNVNRPDDL